MRLIPGALAGLALLLAVAAPGSAAQGDEALMPEQSAAKAKAVLQQVIAALGGPAYLAVRDSDCSGRIAQLGHNDELMGYTQFRDLWLQEDKNRTEYFAKGGNTIAGFLLGVEDLGFAHGGVIITVFNGDQGWMLDKSGVSSQPEDVVKTFTDRVKSKMDNILRSRTNDPSLQFRYAGTDLVDMKESEWIEISDPDGRMLRMAVDRHSHLPLRWAVSTRDPATHEETETVTSLGEFIPIDGIETPLNLSREVDGRKVSQTYYTSCKYNSNLSPELFTRAALEKRAPAGGSKDRK